MASDVVFSAVKAWLVANWTACTINYENETFAAPALVEAPGTPASWIAATFVGNIYDQMSIGSSGGSAERWAEEGSVIFECFVQAGAGSLVARQNATALANLLRGVTLTGNIRMRDMSIGDGSAGIDNGDWWGLTLRCDCVRG